MARRPTPMTRRSWFVESRPRAGRILRFDRSPEAPKITTSWPAPAGPEAGVASRTRVAVFIGQCFSWPRQALSRPASVATSSVLSQQIRTQISAPSLSTAPYDGASPSPGARQSHLAGAEHLSVVEQASVWLSRYGDQIGVDYREGTTVGP